MISGIRKILRMRTACFLCFTNGKPIEECCIKDVSTREYTPGHGRKQRAFLCEWFDGKFPVGGGEEATALRDKRLKEAKRLRENALDRERKVLNKKRAKLAKLAEKTQ